MPWKGTTSPGYINEFGIPVAYNGRKACGVKKKGKDEICMNPAGRGTDHLGYGKCKKHGGTSLVNRLQAAKQEALEISANMVMGLPLDITPMDALLWCVKIAAGEVAYCCWRIEQLTHDEAVGNPQSILFREGGRIWQERTVHAPELHIWIQARHGCLERLARFSKLALDAGVAERQIRLVEQAGEGLATAIRSILDKLELTADQEARAPEVVRFALMELEPGAKAEGLYASVIEGSSFEDGEE